MSNVKQKCIWTMNTKGQQGQWDRKYTSGVEPGRYNYVITVQVNKVALDIRDVIFKNIQENSNSSSEHKIILILRIFHQNVLFYVFFSFYKISGNSNIPSHIVEFILTKPLLGFASMSHSMSIVTRIRDILEVLCRDWISFRFWE